MKKMAGLALAAGLLLSLAACGGTLVPEETEPPLVEGKGLFVLEAGEALDLSGETNLSDGETYAVAVYDIKPDPVENMELSWVRGDYELTMNGVNTYESVDFSAWYKYEIGGGGADSCKNSFLFACGYALPTEVETVLAGGEPFRAVSVFRINKNDLTEESTAQFSIDGSGGFDCTLNFSREEIQTVAFLDEVFRVEEDPRAYQLASTMYIRALRIRQSLDYFSQQGSVQNAAATGIAAVSMQAAADFELSAAYNGDGLPVFYDFSTGSTELTVLDKEETVRAVEQVYPELAEASRTLLEQADVWAENAPLCADSATWTEETQMAAYQASAALVPAADAIIEFFEGRT